MINRRLFEEAKSRLRLGMLTRNVQYSHEAESFILANYKAELRRVNDKIRSFDDITLSDIVKSRGTIISSILSIKSSAPKFIGDFFGFTSYLSAEERAEQHLQVVREQLSYSDITNQRKVNQYGPYLASLQNAYSADTKIVGPLDSTIVRPIIDVSKYEYVSDPSKIHDSFPFKIKNLATGLEFTFPAHIKTLSETDSAVWNTVNPAGASEAIYTYGNSERSCNMDIVLYSASNVYEDDDPSKIIWVGYRDSQTKLKNSTTNSVEDVDQNILNTIQAPVLSKKSVLQRLNFLKSCLRPTYVDGFLSKSPFCLITLGDVFSSSLIVIDSVTSMYTPLVWDLSATSLIFPTVVEIGITFKVLNGGSQDLKSPSAWTNFYRGV